MARKAKRVSSGNQFKMLKTTHVSGVRMARQSTTKKTRKSTKATENYKAARNERDKAQRRISAIQRQLTNTQSPEARRMLETRISNLQHAIELTKTYSPETGKRIRNKMEVERGLRYLKAVNEVSTPYIKSNKQRNKATEIELKRAGKGGMYTSRQVQLFYKETMAAWNREDVPQDKRNQAILDYYGSTDLASLIDTIVNQSSVKELEKAREILQNPDNYTDDDKRWAYEVLRDNDDEYIVSPNSRENAAVTYLPIEAPV